MKYIIEKIEKELNRIDHEDRNLFRDVALKTYTSLVDGIQKRIETFEDKILDSVVTKDQSITMINVIIPRNELYIYEDKFSPIINKDYTEEINLSDGMKNDNLVCKKIIILESQTKLESLQKRKFDGKIFIRDKLFNVKFKLEKNHEYSDQIKHLYKTFELNNLKWSTLNAPYCDKVFNLVLDEYPNELENELILSGEEKIKIEVEKEELKDNWIEDHMICWNIQEITRQGNGTIQPTQNRIHYEHTLGISADKTIYLSYSDDIYIFYLQRMRDEIKIIVDINKSIKWKFVSIIDLPEKEISKKLQYPVFSNRKTMDFINKLKLETNIRIRTAAELKGIIHSYETVKENLEFIKIKIFNDFTDKVHGRDLNDFIEDEFKLKGGRDKLILYFKLKNNDFYVYDILNFIISEVQLYFPEYTCKGVIVNE